MLVSLAVLAASMTSLFLGMRAVMEIGGSCASGGPYVIAQECPEGAGTAMMAGFLGMTLAAGTFVFAAWRLGYAGVLLLGWPALFLSLGWNFFEYGVSPAEGQEDSGDFIFCGVLFAIMGGAPLLGFLALQPRRFAALFWPSPPSPATGRSAERDERPRRRRRVSSFTAREIERLAALHREGALTDDEFKRAKEKLL